MFQPGDFIIYGNNGICKVVEVGKMKNSTADPERLYYTLKPFYGTETIYTPVDTSIFMRPALAKEQAQQLIEKIPSIREDVCMDKSLNALKEHYEMAIQSHRCEDLVQLIKSVHIKSMNAKEQGKKVGQLDQRYMLRAEELLHGELAVVLGIPRDEVVDYIEQVVSNM